jgi:hypothetical protein
MNFGAMKDYKLKVRNLHASHAILKENGGCEFFFSSSSAES